MPPSNTHAVSMIAVAPRSDSQGISKTTVEERPSRVALAYLAGWPGGMLPRGTPGAVSARTQAGLLTLLSLLPQARTPNLPFAVSC